MTENVRQYPNISFVDTDTEALTNSLIRAFERFAGRTLYPADPVRLFILWIADIIIQERVNIDFSAKQNLPRYAEGEYLDSIAELFKDVYRLEPEAARTTIRFTLSIERDTATVIPAGTRLSAGEEIVFATIAALTIPAGRLTGEVAAVCQTAGEIGAHFDMTGATVSHHLSVLKDAGLVSDERRGKFICYELSVSVLDEIVGWLAALKGEDNHEE